MLTILGCVISLKLLVELVLYRLIELAVIPPVSHLAHLVDKTA